MTLLWDQPGSVWDAPGSLWDGDAGAPGESPAPPIAADPLQSFIVPFRTESRGIAFIAPDPNAGALTGLVPVNVLRTTDDYGLPIRSASLMIDGTLGPALTSAYAGFTIEWDTTTITNGLHTLGLATVNTANRQSQFPSIMQVLVANAGS